MQRLGIEPSRCVHELIVHSACSACVQVCPTQAWAADEDGLSFDEDRCDGCGLCAAACPHEALFIAAPELLPSATTPHRLMVSCERADIHSPSSPEGKQAKGVTGCVQSLDPAWLVEHAAQHQASDVYLLTGHCAGCTRSKGMPFETRWRALTMRLAGAGQVVPTLTWGNPAEWRAQVPEQAQAPNQRRTLFQRWLPPRTPGNTPTATRPMNGGRTSAVRLLANARTQAAQTNPHATTVQPLWHVQLRPGSCVWCMACVKICPAHALEMIPSPDGGRALFGVNTAHCTGCNACVEVCDRHAISLDTPAPTAGAAPPRSQQSVFFGLIQHKCPACKAAYWQLANSTKSVSNDAPIAGKCPTCMLGKPTHRQRIIDQGAPATEVGMTQPHAPSGL